MYTLILFLYLFLVVCFFLYFLYNYKIKKLKKEIYKEALFKGEESIVRFDKIDKPGDASWRRAQRRSF